MRYVKKSIKIIASSRRSVSEGAAQKTAREKIKKTRREDARELASSRLAFFFIFSRAVFCAAPSLTERLEEAIKITVLNLMPQTLILRRFGHMSVTLDLFQKRNFSCLKTLKEIL